MRPGKAGSAAFWVTHFAPALSLLDLSLYRSSGAIVG
jgi:hypothetical protein